VKRRVAGGAAGRPAGVALLLVVWLLALLTVIAGEFMASGRVKAAAEINKRDDLRGLALALAGFQLAKAALDQPITRLKLDEDDETLLLFTGGAPDGVKAVASGVPLADGACSWSIRNEDGLVNLNDANLSRTVLAELIKACGVGPGTERDTVIDSILDWRDSGREHRLNGAEEDYYRGLTPPYSCKDGPFDTVEELLLVRGVTPELFAGGPKEGEKEEKRRPGLRDLLSPHAGGFNAGTAPKAVRDATGRAQTEERAAQITQYEIIATGSPGGGAPPRSLRAVVRREDQGGSRKFTLLYWNDNFLPPASRERGGR
jgi:hypothetical protein